MLQIVRFWGSLVSELICELVLTSGPARYFDGKVDAWRHSKAKRLGDGTQIKLINIKYVLLMMRGVGLQIWPVTIFGRTIQIVVLFDQFRELLLNIGQFTLWKLVFVRPNFLLLEISEEAELVLIYKKQGPSSAVSSSGCPADPMDIVIGVVGWVELNNPIDVWKV